MSRTHARLAVLACAAALFSTAALSQDAPKNPLLKPKPVKAADVAPVAATSLPPAPGLKDRLPAAGESTSADRVASHLAMLRVVATVGDKAILRGPLGKTGNLALSSQSGPGADESAAGAPAPAGQAPAPAGGGTETKAEKSPVRSITVTNGEPVQLADGVWVRPEISGPSVRLYLQRSTKEHSESLIYSSSIEIADAAAATLTERQFETKKGPQTK